MNILELELRFWETIYHFIHNEKFRLVYLNNSDKEVWLEDEKQQPYQLIRIALRDIDWRNELRQDIVKAFQQGKRLKRELGLRKTNVLNIVFSLYEPVDDYEELINKPLSFTTRGNQIQRTALIPLEKLNEKIIPLATKLNLKEKPRYIMTDPAFDIEQLIRNFRYSIQEASKNQLQHEKSIFLFGKPVLTYFLLAVQIIVFLLMELNGSSTSTTSLIQFGAKFNPLIIEGEWWRFFTAMFLHIGVFHLIMNSLALYYLGTAVEQIYGTARFFFIYMLAGFVGSVASFVFNDHVSAGASGAIFGCFGALLFFGTKHRRLFFRTMGMNVIVILAINLVFGFVMPMVDNGAHIGGLLGGFAASAIVGLPNKRSLKVSFSTLIVIMIAIFGLLQYGYSQEESLDTYTVYFQLGLDYIEQGEMEEAKEQFEKIVAADEAIVEPLLLDSYFYLSYTQVHLEELLEAEKNLLKTIELDEDDELTEAHFNLCLVYYQLGKFREAYEQIQIALEEDPNNDDYKRTELELRRIFQ